MIIPEDDMMPRRNNQGFEQINTKSDVFAVEFMSEWTVAAGERLGGINLFDRRVKYPREGRASVIHHPGSVIHIKKVDGATMIVNGIQNSVCSQLLCSPANYVSIQT